METPLARLYFWERRCAERVHLVQPLGAGEVVEYRWAQLMDQARRMARYLLALDLPPGSHIALLGKNSAHWIIADYAIWMAGHVSVPLFPTLNALTVRYVLEHSEARLLFVGKLDAWETMRDGVPDGLPMIALPQAPEIGALSWDEITCEVEPLLGYPDRHPEETATIVYTSGSTGRPKGVMLSFAAYSRAAQMLEHLLAPHADDRMLSYLPLAHVAERIAVEGGSTFHGYTLYFGDGTATFADDLRRARPTLFFSVPRLWSKFQAAVNERMSPRRQTLLFALPLIGRLVRRRILAQLGLADVRIAFTGAAPMPPALGAWYRRLGLKFLMVYGMSENCAYSHHARGDDPRPGTVGLPNPGVQCRIGANGEIEMKSPTLMRGYYKDPRATAASFTADGFLRTGDMGEIDADGQLLLTGRLNELYKTSKGKSVAPLPIERALSAHPLVEAVCVSGAGQPSSLALVQIAEEARARLKSGALAAMFVEQEMQTLRGVVNATLDPHEQLHCIVLVNDRWDIDNGLLTPTLKIRRERIEGHYRPRFERWFALRRPVIWAS